MHVLHSSGHLLFVIGLPIGKSELISITDNLTLGPYFSVIKTSFLPIHPKPALTLTNLNENGAVSVSSLDCSTGGM